VPYFFPRVSVVLQDFFPQGPVAVLDFPLNLAFPQVEVDFLPESVVDALMAAALYHPAEVAAVAGLNCPA